jgi:hypothetical protein
MRLCGLSLLNFIIFIIIFFILMIQTIFQVFYNFGRDINQFPIYLKSIEMWKDYARRGGGGL